MGFDRPRFKEFAEHSQHTDTQISTQVINMPIGRPRAPGTEEERAEARRAKVRVNVQAFRKRQKEKKSAVEAEVKVYQERKWFGQLQVPNLFDDSSMGTDSMRSSTSSCRTSPESDYADPDSWIWLTRDLVSHSIYYHSFLTSVQDEHFPLELPRDLPGHDAQERSQQASWLSFTMLEDGGAGTDLVTDALLASALTAISQDRNDPDMALQGAYIQSRAIRRLRIALQQFAANEVNYCTSMLSLAALTCAMSELLASHSWTHFSNHLTGVGALLQCGGPEKLQTSTARDLFYGYRSLQVAFSLTYGQETFLSEMEWVDPPWKREVPVSQHPLHTLLDIAYKAVPEIAKARVNRDWEISDLKEHLRRLDDISSQLDGWERALNLTHRGILFRQKDAEWKGLHEHALEFANLPCGIAYAMYTGVRIKMAGVMNRVMSNILATDGFATVDTTSPVSEGLRWSRVALQCLEYFHTGPPKTIGYITTLFPLDSAWEYLSCIEVNVLTDVSQECDFCLATAQRLSEINIPVFRWR